MEKIQTVPITINSTAAILKTLFDNIELVGLGEHLYKSMRKTVLLATARNFHFNHGPNNLETAHIELNPSDI